jgi:hypothetical protein
LKNQSGVAICKKFAAGPRDRRRLRESAASGLAARSKRRSRSESAARPSQRIPIAETISFELIAPVS